MALPSLLPTGLAGNLAKKYPAIIAEYVTDAGADPDYDHIIPVIGAGSFITFYNLYSTTAMTFPESRFSATRATCKRTLLQGGCAPLNVDYGVAVTGIAGGTGLGSFRPVRLDVPNPIQPKTPTLMQGTVTVSGLTAGKTYRLLRYINPATVPVTAAAALGTRPVGTTSVDFNATGATYKLVDPVKFLSSSTTFYRCVALP